MSTPPVLRTHFLDPVRAEIGIDWAAWQPGDEIRGKLRGPSCRYASTIEIAYPVTPSKAGYRIVLPEPSAWDPISPFVYTGKLELVRAGECIQEVRVVHGLLQLVPTPAGLRLNGKPFELRPIAPLATDEAALLDLRAQGFNSLQVDSADPFLWDRAARIGFFLQTQDRENLPLELQLHFLTL